MPTDAERDAYNAKFVQRLLARRKDALDRHADVLRDKVGVQESVGGDPLAGRPVFETLQDPAVVSAAARREVLETIVRRERPVLFVQNGQFNTTGVTTLGAEAEELVGRMRTSAAALVPLLPLVGRFDVTHFPNTDFIGTGWFVAEDVVVTNRHVASLVAENDGREWVFRRGVGGQPMTAAVCTAHEFDDPTPAADRVFAVRKVLYIAPPGGPDMAFVRVARPAGGNGPRFIPVAPADAADNDPVCVVGYPARAPRSVIPNQQLMNDLYQGRFDVKRAAPGFSMGLSGGSAEHDCTTLGGNSGSVLLDFRGRAVGLHFAGLYEQANFAVPASVLRDFIDRRRWDGAAVDLSAPAPLTPHETPAAPAPHTPAGGHKITVTVPVTITIEVGAPTVVPVSPPDAPQPARPQAVEVSAVEAALVPYWDAKPEGVLAARVGFTADDPPHPFLAASVAPHQWAAVRDRGPADFRGVPVRYLPATVDEQIAARPDLEAVSAIAYDDDARKGKRFSFEPVEEEMEVLLHVGPEFSWDTLKGFLGGAKKELVAAMYEFHAEHIKDAIEGRLDDEVRVKLVLDNTTFAGKADEDGRFDPVAVFDEWATAHSFERVVAPEGTGGLIANAYHIKVTVRDGDTFWLSSGNWKGGSSQPKISQRQRDESADTDLPGNREWHVVVANKTLAGRYRNHILQDFQTSLDLGGGPLPPRLMRDETFADVPLHEAVALERKPPSRLIPPKTVKRAVKVRPLLTPDRQGAVYSEAVLDLIKSARHSLLFQIPYIAMPSDPRADRGFIDQLIAALVAKLKSLADARVILRSGGNKFSSPTHAAWFFKSKGVDTDARLRAIENHHTKGMIVDGKRVLLGSHNWSQPGVSLNRDASLLFDDAEVAAYYADAFEVDWARSNPIRAKKFVREAVAGVAVAAPAFRQVKLSDWLADD